MATAEAVAPTPVAKQPSPTSTDRLATAAGDVLVLLGDWSSFSVRAVTGTFTRHLKTRELIAACVSVGVNSLGVIAITGLFIGMVLAVQAYNELHQVGLDTSLGAIIHMSVVRELGPVLTAVMLAGRVGSAMAAQIGTMRVTEQVDALACLGVDPVRFLATARFLAAILMVPLLTVFADLMGLFGSTFICLRVYHIEAYHYWRHTQNFVGPWDVTVGLMKSVAFGGVVALIACHRGFHSRAGAEGVGRAATEAFVVSFVAILALDFVMAMLLNALSANFWPQTGVRMV
jgi:phospholipid/cholesterol/gamma-HCH transport system permease protein